ncbi:MAG: winged helix-turn-helix transcriptional regulator [Chloroflexi bacterium]|nr:winged helix-turn-helix transcriptional regulator [Chloroflexota bacterium]
MRELAKAFQALSDETRLRILSLLLVRECCVCEVMQALEISQTRASRNLNLLYDAGLLRQRKEGLWSLYSVDRERMGQQFIGLVQAVEHALDDSPAVATDREKLKKAQRAGPGCGS